MNAVKINLGLKLLISREETTPIRLEILILRLLLLTLACMDVKNVPDLINFVLLLGLVIGVGGGVGVVITEGINLGWKCACGWLLPGLSCCILLSLSLVPQLVVDVGIQSSYLIVVDEDSDFTLPVSELVPLEFHLLTSSKRLSQGLILHQNIGPLRGQLIAFNFKIPHKSKPGEERGEILLIGKLRIIPHGSIEYRYEMLLDLIQRIVADHIKPLEMICKEDLEVVIVRQVQSCIDIVVIRTGIGCVLHFEVLHEDEVLDHLDVLDLAVFAEEGPDRLLVRIIEAAYVEFANEDAFVDLLGGLGLLHEFFLLGLGQFGEHLMDCQIICNGVVSNCQSNFLLFLLGPQLVVVAALSGSRAGVRTVMSLIVSPVLHLSLVVMLSPTPAVFVGIGSGT